MLTKEKCLEALSSLEMEIMHASSLSYRYKERVLSVSNVLFQLINEHFDNQFLNGEIDLMISLLKTVEDELGMDITLLIDKLMRIQKALPKDKSVVESIEFY